MREAMHGLFRIRNGGLQDAGPFAPQALGHMELADMFIHETVDGRRLLVIHGDFFDHLTKHAAWIYHLGDRAYT